MSVRKRTWVTRQGEPREAWIVDYSDQRGARHIHTFARKKDADAYEATVRVDVGRGVHTAPNRSITVAEAAADWVRYAKLEKLEAATIAGYQQHVIKHIVPRLGATKLATLTTPRVQAFRDELLTDMSRPMAKKVLTSLKAILKDAKRRGNVAQNVAADVAIGIDGRSKSKLAIGKDIPTRDEIRRIVDAAPEGRGRALLMTAAFTGLRASEIRGLRWSDVNLKKAELQVRQRADRFGTIGRPKSASGERSLPIGPMVVNTLRQWKLECPKGELVFPTGVGTIENHSNIVQRILGPAQLAAKVLDQGGKAKYPGLHSLRHFYASWCINRRQDGGLELPPKTVQARLGHASIVMTLDRYGHLFPSHDDGAELAAAERAIFAT
jgi:integrase